MTAKKRSIFDIEQEKAVRNRQEIIEEQHLDAPSKPVKAEKSRYNFYITVDEREKLESIAVKRGISSSQVIRELIQKAKV